MRSIGKRNITLVKTEVMKELRRQKKFIFSSIDYSEAREKIRENLPVELWDTWEMADQQIDNIIEDVLTQYAHGEITL